MNIPRFLQLYKEDRLDEAFEAVVLDNPLPASTGRICQHPCEDRCRRRTVDDSVNMREVHRFIADSIYQSDRFEPLVARIRARILPPTDRRIAVVGAGPSGLTAAYYLALLGHEVTIYDANAEPGGMLRYALPEYRLPRDVVRREVDLIRRMGVNFVGNAGVGTDITLDQLDSEYNAVFLAIGAWREPFVHVPGTELNGVMPALSFLEEVAKDEPARLGRRVVVIGGGNAAVDSARTSLRMGSEVKVIYRRERKDMPAIPEETEAAQHEGVKFVFLATPHRIVGDENGNVKAIEVVKTKLGEFDSSGRRRPVLTEEIRRFECDSVILAVGESVDPDFARASGLKLNPDGTLAVDRHTLETSRSKFYAGGDLITGASNVSNSMGFGKKAARNIDARLMGGGRWEGLQAQFTYSDVPPAQPSSSRRHVVFELPAAERAEGFTETVIGLSAAEALDESGRCLRCDIRDHH
jgi:NADPH-dependent glutamate synthase beta subunit-like oxidoreductase